MIAMNFRIYQVKVEDFSRPSTEDHGELLESHSFWKIVLKIEFFHKMIAWNEMKRVD